MQFNADLLYLSFNAELSPGVGLLSHVVLTNWIASSGHRKTKVGDMQVMDIFVSLNLKVFCKGPFSKKKTQIQTSRIVLIWIGATSSYSKYQSHTVLQLKNHLQLLFNTI